MQHAFKHAKYGLCWSGHGPNQAKNVKETRTGPWSCVVSRLGLGQPKAFSEA